MATSTSYTTEEGTHTLADGTQLYTKTWKPTIDTPRAIIAFFHGFSDHCNAYYEFFPALADHGIEVRAVDQRGWGRSVTKPSDRGLTGPTSLVLADMQSFLLSLCPPKVPLFLMGHSMGGAQVLTYILHPESPFNRTTNQSRPELSGVLVYSPLIAIHPSTRPSTMKVALGRLAGKLLPRWQLYSPVDAKLVSRDPQVCADYAADELCHDTGTLAGLAGMLDRGIWLEGVANGDGNLSEITETAKKAPSMWLCHGNSDQVTDYEATRQFIEVVNLKDKTFKTYEGGYHRLHSEPEGIKEQFVKDITAWILERSSPAQGENSNIKAPAGATEGDQAPGRVEIEEEETKSKL